MSPKLPNAFIQGYQLVPKELQTNLITDGKALHTKLTDLANKHLAEYTPMWLSLPRIWACSPYAKKLCLQNPQWVLKLFMDKDINKISTHNDYQQQLKQLISNQDSYTDVLRKLRLFRQQAMLKILWRDLNGWAHLTDTLKQLSSLADACIHCAASWSHQAVLAKHHSTMTSIHEHVSNHPLIILGLGKLGGHELNFSSDVDLIFCYANPPQNINEPTKQTYIKIAQNIISLLHQTTEDGFVFRVDLRLRPFGVNSDIVMSEKAMINYYMHHAETWERYPLIKTRLVSGLSKDFLPIKNRIERFVYGGDIDITAMYTLKAVHTRLIANLSEFERKHHIKSGYGGIRELEFIVQAQQLLYGNHHFNLRTTSWRASLLAVEEENYLQQKTTAMLERSYCFFRHIEHRLQAVYDQQTHLLPSDQLAQTRLAFALHVQDWQQAEKTINHYRNQVHQVFLSLLKEPTPLAKLNAHSYQEKGRHLPLSEMKLKTQYPNKHPLLVPWFTSWIHSQSYKALSELGLRRFNTFMPKLIKHIVQYPTPQIKMICNAFNELLPTLLERSIYMMLLCDRTAVLKHLVFLSAKSNFLMQQISRYPTLLGELIEPKRMNIKMTLFAMENRLAHELNTIDPKDTSAKIKCLHHFKQVHLFRIANQQLTNKLSIIRTSDLLTNVATAIVRQVATITKPSLPHNAEDHFDDIMVIAYGKFGSIELSYHSDLDLVCTYNSQQPQANEFYTGWCQAMLQMFNHPILGQPLYEIDMRLRPNGQTGRLVRPLDALAEYLHHRAWIWEKQALLRARPIYGNQIDQAQFSTIRHQVITASCQQSLFSDIQKMREKIAKNSPIPADFFDLKHSPGGILDIEFFTQKMCLKWSRSIPKLLLYTDNIRQLSELHQHQVLDHVQYQQLTHIFLILREQLQKRQLTTSKPKLPKLIECAKESTIQNKMKCIHSIIQAHDKKLQKPLSTHL